MATTKYRKLPVEIEAKQLVGTTAEMYSVYCWVESHIGSVDPYRDGAEGISIDPADGRIVIRTLEGNMKAEVGDYIIRGVQGEFYPCKPDIFEKTYEAI